jgi:L-asparagine transporter-like permease
MYISLRLDTEWKICKLENLKLPHTYYFLRSEEKSLRTDYYLIQFTAFFGLIVLVGLFSALIFLEIPRYCGIISLVVYATFGCGTYYMRKNQLENDLPTSSLESTEKVCPVCGSKLPKPEKR